MPLSRVQEPTPLKKMVDSVNSNFSLTAESRWQAFSHTNHRLSVTGPLSLFLFSSPLASFSKTSAKVRQVKNFSGGKDGDEMKRRKEKTCAPTKSFPPGCLFLPGCMSRVLSQCRQPSSTLKEGRVKSSGSKPKLARALRDTAADRARILGAFFLPEGAGDGGRRSPQRGLHWHRFAHMTAVTCWGSGVAAAT